MYITPYQIAERFVGIEEVPGAASNPQILAMLRLDAQWPRDDSVPWCSAFCNYVAWLLRLARPKGRLALRARSWLKVGRPVAEPELGWTVVILKRGAGDQPGEDVIDAPGHVGFYAAQTRDHVWLLGGNQGDSVSIAQYSRDRILGYRSLRPLGDMS